MEFCQRVFEIRSILPLAGQMMISFGCLALRNVTKMPLLRWGIEPSTSLTYFPAKYVNYPGPDLQCRCACLAGFLSLPSCSMGQEQQKRISPLSISHLDHLHNPLCLFQSCWSRHTLDLITGNCWVRLARSIYELVISHLCSLSQGYLHWVFTRTLFPSAQ